MKQPLKSHERMFGSFCHPLTGLHTGLHRASHSNNSKEWLFKMTEGLKNFAYCGIVWFCSPNVGC